MTPFAFLEALPLPAMSIGADERVEAANAALVEVLGTGLEGRHYITALRQPQILDAVEAVLGGEPRSRAEFFGRDGGRDITWRVTASAVHRSRGRGVILCFEDLSAIETAEAMRRDFVSNVSHELRTPLTSMLGFIETLGGPAKGDPAARDRFLAIMKREAERMSQLVADLLSLSRVEENERRRPTGAVDLAALVQEVQSALAPVIDAAGAVVELSLPPQPVFVPADPDQLRQVIINLVENAIKYGGEGGRVEIVVTAPTIQPSLRAEGVVLTVRDHGRGIEAHHLPRLTERFYRADPHRSRDVGGTGLGLAIVKHIVNRHRGRLRIESWLGQGTLVSVVLPATHEVT